MIEVELQRITINDTGDKQYITLAEKAGDRQLTIVIGYNEAQAIDRFVKGTKMARPLTHDLVVALLEASGADVQKVEVVDLKEGTFYAVLHLLRLDGTEAQVDARPSDAIAIVTALGRPIFVAEDVMREASNV